MNLNDYPVSKEVPAFPKRSEVLELCRVEGWSKHRSLKDMHCAERTVPSTVFLLPKFRPWVC